jgi:hypothetical protein
LRVDIMREMRAFALDPAKNCGLPTAETLRLATSSFP